MDVRDVDPPRTSSRLHRASAAFWGRVVVWPPRAPLSHSSRGCVCRRPRNCVASPSSPPVRRAAAHRFSGIEEPETALAAAGEEADRPVGLGQPSAAAGEAAGQAEEPAGGVSTPSGVEPRAEEEADASVPRGQARASGAPQPAAERAARPSGEAPSVARGRPAAAVTREWAYVVWRAPAAKEDIVGVHTGGARAWRGIADRLPGRAYAYRDGTRLRRIPDAELAAAAYAKEAGQHGAPLPTRRFYW